ncbi:MAG: hypothetical protein LBT63_00730 [Holosporaceae bacterium]|jgi:hypothetical protein|nr:hypothetical protein [Holosporaceae bacterium]
MLRSDHDSIAKRYIVGSITLHALVFVCSSVTFFQPQKSDLLLMDVELAGEGELRDTLNRRPEESPPSEEIPPEQEPPEPAEAKPEEPKEPAQENAEPEEKVEEPGAEEEIPPVQEDDAGKKAENPKEEPVPQINEEPTIEEKKPSVKRRDKKAMLEIIKKAEKQIAKAKARKKLLEIVHDTSKKKRDEDFDKMLNKSIKDMRKNAGNGKRGNGRGGTGSGVGLSEGDYEMISSQIYPHWAVPSGVRDAENIIIEIRVQIRDNGQVVPSSIKILDERRYATDYVFRAAADSARRAILEASPLKIPRDKVDLFRDFILRFNLKEALGG